MLEFRIQLGLVAGTCFGVRMALDKIMPRYAGQPVMTGMTVLKLILSWLAVSSCVFAIGNVLPPWNLLAGTIAVVADLIMLRFRPLK